MSTVNVPVLLPRCKVRQSTYIECVHVSLCSIYRYSTGFEACCGCSVEAAKEAGIAKVPHPTVGSYFFFALTMKSGPTWWIHECLCSDQVYRNVIPLHRVALTQAWATTQWLLRVFSSLLLWVTNRLVKAIALWICDFDYQINLNLTHSQITLM